MRAASSTPAPPARPHWPPPAGSSPPLHPQTPPHSGRPHRAALRALAAPPPDPTSVASVHPPPLPSPAWRDQCLSCPLSPLGRARRGIRRRVLVLVARPPRLLPLVCKGRRCRPRRRAWRRRGRRCSAAAPGPACCRCCCSWPSSAAGAATAASAAAAALLPSLPPVPLPPTPLPHPLAPPPLPHQPLPWRVAVGPQPRGVAASAAPAAVAASAPAQFRAAHSRPPGPGCRSSTRM